MKQKKFFLRVSGLSALIIPCCIQLGTAQVTWQSKGPLYQDAYVAVEIEYAVGADACTPGTSPSQFRYKLIKFKSHGDYYINWRVDYFNCNHELKTRQNSLHILKSMQPGYIAAENSQFSAFKIVNYTNDVKKSVGLPEPNYYQPVSTTSLAPKAITGNLITNGQATTLGLQGGYLAQNTSWKWYQGDCAGNVIGSGETVKVQPTQTTTYAVRGEGQSPTTCTLVTVTVLNSSSPAQGIEGLSSVCEGTSDLRLNVVGGKLAPKAKWVWYKDECGGVPIGEGPGINVTPVATTTYFVRAEGPEGKTICQSHQVVVTAKSTPAESIESTGSPVYGETVILSVSGGYLSPDAQWVWYQGRNERKVQVGYGLSYIVRAASSDETYYVRAEGTCFNSDFVSKTIMVSKPEIKLASHPAPTTFFINGGIVASDASQLNQLKNYVATIGGGRTIGWFLRAKINADQISASYQTSGAQIIDYNVAGYYQYNGRSVNKRTAYTGGAFIGGANLAIYIGGGYGTRELLYGIDQYRYSPALLVGSSWVKDPAHSYTGVEIEGGLMIKAGFINIMGGASTIQGKYFDYNLGIGFNF